MVFDIVPGSGLVGSLFRITGISPQYSLIQANDQCAFTACKGTEITQIFRLDDNDAACIVFLQESAQAGNSLFYHSITLY